MREENIWNSSDKLYLTSLKEIAEKSTVVSARHGNLFITVMKIKKPFGTLVDLFGWSSESAVKEAGRIENECSAIKRDLVRMKKKKLSSGTCAIEAMLGTFS